MERPTYIPQVAWNIMTDANKREFFKKQKIQHPIINLEGDYDTDINIIKKETFVKREKLNHKEETKKTYVNFYKNKLFEIQHGYWVIKNNWRREQLQLVNTNNVNIPNKIYKLHYDFSILIDNIVCYKLFLDGREINKFDNNILVNEWNIPREYIILI